MLIRDLALILLTVFCIHGSGYDVSQLREPETVPAVEFSYACEYADVFYGVKCDDLKAPYVFYVPFPSNLAGEYSFSANYILVNGWGVDFAEDSDIRVHETMHYIMYMKGGVTDGCISEEISRRVTASWQHVPYNDEWRQWYGCTNRSR